MARPLISALTAVLLLAVTVTGASSAASAADDVQVDVGSFYFCNPSFLNSVCETTIATGDTVVWDFVEGLHTATQCDDTFATCPPSDGFDSGFLSPGDTFSQTFTTPATISYWCALHPVQMRGRIIVEGQVTPTATPEPTPTQTPDPTPASTPEPTATPDDDTPTPSPVMTPAEVPSTGGTPTASGGSSLAMLIGVLGITIATAGALALVGARRR